MQFFFFCVAILVQWSTEVISVDQIATTFTVVREGRKPVAGVFEMETVALDSSIECAQKCLMNGVNAGCSGFLYQPFFCDPDSNVSPTVAGVCSLLQYFELKSLLYGSTNSSCEQFYASITTVKPSNLVNLALRQYAVQQSTYSGTPASKAVDGSTGTEACTQSYNYANPWWAVDLSQPTNVRVVRVTNYKADSSVYKLDNFMVGLTNTKPSPPNALNAGSDYVRCAQFNGRVPASATATVVCAPSSVLYRYVIVQAWSSALCTQEVEVY